VVSNKSERDDLEPDDFRQRAQTLFEDSVERLDARTRSKLTQARNLALDEVKKGAAQRRWIWAPAGGFALAAVIAVGVVFWPGRTPQPGAAALEDLEIVADRENLELLQDVEFYAWLDEQ
jgi:hypothetical protein